MNQNPEVKLHFLDYWRVIKLRIGLILLTFFLVVITAVVYVFFLPKEYASKVTIEIKPDNNKGVDPLGGQATSRADPQFISTQFQVLKKNEILYPVIERLDLVKELSPPGQRYPLPLVARLLGNSMNVQEARNTTLIEILVYNTKPQMAADIANTIALVYQEKRIAYLRELVDKTLGEMKDELEKRKLDMKVLYDEAAKVRDEESIIDPDPENFNALVSLAERSVAGNDELRIAKSTLVNELEAQLTIVDGLKPEELQEALRQLKIEDTTVVANLSQLEMTRAEEAKLINSGLGEKHPNVTSLRAQMEVYRSILSDRLNAIKASLSTKLKLEKQNLTKLEEEYDKAKMSQRDEKKRTNRYAEKKAAFVSAKNLYFAIAQRYAAEMFNQKLSFEPVKIWEKAEPGSTWEKPKVPVYIALAALIGIVVGVGLAFFIEYLDTSVKTIEDIERYLSLPILAVIPKDIAVLIKQKRDSADAEAYRILKANIEFNQTDREANSFTLVSGGPGEGKSTTLNNLAFAYAKGGSKVLIVDADLRRPSQHRFFDIDNSVGLADYLQGKVTIESILKPTKLENLMFIPSGRLPHDDAGILNSSRMTDLMKQLKGQYDIVFFDSPPILGVSDASLLVSEVDNTIMVVQHRRFPRGMLQRVKQSVVHVGGNLIGVVLNNVDTKQDDSYSYYSSYNDYYAPRRERAGEQPKPAIAAKSDDGEY